MCCAKLCRTLAAVSWVAAEEVSGLVQLRCERTYPWWRRRGRTGRCRSSHFARRVSWFRKRPRHRVAAVEQGGQREHRLRKEKTDSNPKILLCDLERQCRVLLRARGVLRKRVKVEQVRTMAMNKCAAGSSFVSEAQLREGEPRTRPVRLGSSS